MASMALFILFFNLIAVFISVAFQSNLSELSLGDIEEHITNRQWIKPLCILFIEKAQFKALNFSKSRESMSRIARRISKIEKDITRVMHMPCFETWNFGKFYFQEDSLPQLLNPAWNNLLRCYIGTASSHNFDLTMSLGKWMHKLRMIHGNRLEIHQDDDLHTVFQSDLTSKFFIIVLPGGNLFETVEASLYEVRQSCQSCRILIAPRESQLERSLSEKFPNQAFPSTLIYHREKERMLPRLRKVLQGIYSSTKEHMLLHIMALRSRAEILTLENFKSSLTSVRKSKEPLVACFYSSSAPESYKVLHAFERSILYFGRSNVQADFTKTRFGLVDLAAKENSKIISRYLDVLSVQRIPFVAIFWAVKSTSEGYAVDEVKQKIFNDVVPTPWNIHVSLKELLITPDDHINKHEMHICSSNTTADTCLAEDEPHVYFGPVFNRTLIVKKKTKKVRPLMKKFLGIPLVTDKLWPQIIENILPMKKSILGLTSTSLEAATVKMVVFIMADCGYCEMMMPSFANLTKFAQRLYSTSVYLMNCTSDPIQCKRNSVTGYPTLALFRSVSEEESKNCLLPNSTSSSVRLDYHGNMQVDDILSWLSKASMSAVYFNLENRSLQTLKNDVRLVAHVYTKELASKYLSRWLQQKLIPLQCFKLACEKLFGTVECIVIPSTDVVTEYVWKRKIREKDLVLDQVSFQRIDGVSTTVFKLSYPMENTIERGHGTNLHKFHNKHRYSIPNGFRCEDNHPLCTDILVKFVEDHRRLPITHITRESFHVHGTSASIFSKEFPVLIALVHKNNISTNSSFLKGLEKAAKALYTKLIVATLNVDEFPSWASQFVPRDYHFKHHDSLDKIPALYYYPRFCIIEWNDHQHAAFYPPLEELERTKDVRESLSNITATNIIEFAEQYLRSKDHIIVDTEMF